MKIIPVLHNIRSIYNVGAILRTCDGLGIGEVALSGYTPRYNDPTALPHLRAKLNRQIEKSALGAEESVQQEIVTDVTRWLDEKSSAGALIVGLENNLSSEEAKRRLILGGDDLWRELGVDLDDADNGRDTVDNSRGGTAQNAAREARRNLVVILGEEVQGIPPEIRERCRWFLEIPMHGRKESFNVSVATAIALWELKKLGA